MLRRASFALAFTALAALAPAKNCYAQFFKLNSLSYVADQHAAVIISPSNLAPGVFIGLSSTATSPQAMNPANFAVRDSASLFLRYEPGSNRYTALLVGSQEYVIQGNLSILLKANGEQLRIALDQSGVVPYLSVTRDAGQRGAILGLAANQPIVNLGSELAMALLEANKIQAQRPEVHPYEIGPSAILQVDGKSVNAPRIGLELPLEHSCLAPGVKLIVDQRGQDPSRRAPATVTRSLSDFLILNVVDDRLVVFDYLNSSFGVVFRSVSSNADETTCTLSVARIR